MKKLLSLLLALCLLLGCVPLAAYAADGSFSDVPPNSWYSNDVAFMVQKGYISGTGNNKFSPSDTTTRAMFVTILGRIAGVNIEEYLPLCRHPPRLGRALHRMGLEKRHRQRHGSFLLTCI